MLINRVGSGVLAREACGGGGRLLPSNNIKL